MAAGMQAGRGGGKQSGGGKQHGAAEQRGAAKKHGAAKQSGTVHGGGTATAHGTADRHPAAKPNAAADQRGTAKQHCAAKQSGAVHGDGTAKPHGAADRHASAQSRAAATPHPAAKGARYALPALLLPLGLYSGLYLFYKETGILPLWTIGGGYVLTAAWAVLLTCLRGTHNALLLGAVLSKAALIPWFVLSTIIAAGKPEWFALPAAIIYAVLLAVTAFAETVGIVKLCRTGLLGIPAAVLWSLAAWLPGIDIAAAGIMLGLALYRTRHCER